MTPSDLARACDPCPTRQESAREHRSSKTDWSFPRRRHRACRAPSPAGPSPSERRRSSRAGIGTGPPAPPADRGRCHRDGRRRPHLPRRRRRPGSRASRQVHSGGVQLARARTGAGHAAVQLWSTTGSLRAQAAGTLGVDGLEPDLSAGELIEDRADVPRRRRGSSSGSASQAHGAAASSSDRITDAVARRARVCTAVTADATVERRRGSVSTTAASHRDQHVSRRLLDLHLPGGAPTPVRKTPALLKKAQDRAYASWLTDQRQAGEGRGRRRQLVEEPRMSTQANPTQGLITAVLLMTLAVFESAAEYARDQAQPQPVPTTTIDHSSRGRRPSTRTRRTAAWQGRPTASRCSAPGR